MQQTARASEAAVLERAAGGPEASHFADAAEVARLVEPDGPVHCFSAATLARQVRRFLDGFPGEVSYAVKSNSGAHVLATAAAAGLETFDVASVEEIVAVRAVAPAARLHYHNPVKSRLEIARAFADHGVRRFAVDHPSELAKIAEVVGGEARLEIAVRFRLPRHSSSAHDFSSKFGADPAAAARLLAEVVALGHAPVLTFHVGSQCTDPAAYRRHIEAAAAIAARAGCRLAALNVGGGFPSRYLDAPTPALEAYFAEIAEATRHAFGEVGAPPLECEPGRGLVAACTSVLARVKHIRPDLREVFLNDGIYGSLMEVYQAPGLQPPYRLVRVGRRHEGEPMPFVAFGPTCDPLDRLPNVLQLPADLAEGDYLELGGLGAYGTATATRFNGYGAAPVLRVDRVMDV